MAVINPSLNVICTESERGIGQLPTLYLIHDPGVKVQPVEVIVFLLIHAEMQFKVQVMPGRIPRIAQQPDLCALRDLLALFYVDLVHVRVDHVSVGTCQIAVG